MKDFRETLIGDMGGHIRRMPSDASTADRMERLRPWLEQLQRYMNRMYLLYVKYGPVSEGHGLAAVRAIEEARKTMGFSGSLARVELVQRRSFRPSAESSSPYAKIVGPGGRNGVGGW
jgi:hypothetical protein